MKKNEYFLQNHVNNNDCRQRCNIVIAGHFSERCLRRLEILFLGKFEELEKMHLLALLSLLPGSGLLASDLVSLEFESGFLKKFLRRATDYN